MLTSKDAVVGSDELGMSPVSRRLLSWEPYILGVDGCPSGSSPIPNDPDECKSASAHLGFTYSSGDSQNSPDAECNYCAACVPPISRSSVNQGARAHWICKNDRTSHIDITILSFPTPPNP